MIEITGADSSSSPDITFDLTLNSGKYGFKALSASKGWAITGDYLTVSRNSYTIAAQSMSYAGGYFSI